MATLDVTIKTGGDDLRSGSHANFYVKLQNSPVKEFMRLVGGLGGGSETITQVEVPELTDPNQVEFFQLQHVSQEKGTETADNWDLESIQVILRAGRFPAVVGEHGAHRFAGDSRLITFGGTDT
ncbi:hypothetical protein H6F88_21685 [Oculatella sp. FACHB-28]|uniref:hypothetical protein n=1 Tax=Oculatella sp. FACHB-28 TaxID=2692845 RepID=UPI001683B700|nr:hypothetical protein [Oculatella sp. FACHB-28]MBD1865800.1 hypothetical protein [Cyanobacteria bacterium FACHB-471]MBD2058576.1 hypothetical protein [Oculatella sp. FACHB-28]